MKIEKKNGKTFRRHTLPNWAESREWFSVNKLNSGVREKQIEDLRGWKMFLALSSTNNWFNINGNIFHSSNVTIHIFQATFYAFPSQTVAENSRFVEIPFHERMQQWKYWKCQRKIFPLHSACTLSCASDWDMLQTLIWRKVKELMCVRVATASRERQRLHLNLVAYLPPSQQKLSNENGKNNWAKAFLSVQIERKAEKNCFVKTFPSIKKMKFMQG